MLTLVLRDPGYRHVKTCGRGQEVTRLRNKRTHLIPDHEFYSNEIGNLFPNKIYGLNGDGI